MHSLDLFYVYGLFVKFNFLVFLIKPTILILLNQGFCNSLNNFPCTWKKFSTGLVGATPREAF